MTLAELQASFHALATAADAPAAPRADADTFLVGTPDLPAAARLDVYAGMYLARQVDALREEFPATAVVLGDRAFFEAARAYVAVHPSESPDLGQLGRRLAAFLGARPELSRRADVADLAALEWARSEVFFEAEAPPVGPEALAAIAPEALGEARLRLSPALRLLRFRCDPLPAWRAAQAGAAAEAPGPGPGAAAAAVWRCELQAVHAALPTEEADALERALAGAPLAEVCAAFAEQDAPVQGAFEAISSWLAEGWVVGVEA
jgi:hypothetical protein